MRDVTGGTGTPAERLKALLAERGWTQEQLGDAAGVQRTKVNAYVNGRERLGLKNAARFEEALGVAPGYLGVMPSRQRQTQLEDRVAALQNELRLVRAQVTALDALLRELAALRERERSSAPHPREHSEAK